MSGDTSRKKQVETFEELQKEIEKMFSKAEIDDDNPDYPISTGFDVSIYHTSIWHAVMRCETFFRNTNDIRALENQVGLLMEMGDVRYRGAYLQDAYAICKRILEIDPTREKAKHTIEEHIIPYFRRSYDDPELKNLNNTDEEIESFLEEHFKKVKEKNFDYFLDDWDATYTLVDEDGKKSRWD